MEDNTSSSSMNLVKNTVNSSINIVRWNDKLESSAKNIGESAKGYKLMHIAEAQKAHKIYNRLMILGIVLGPVAGLLSSLNASMHPETDSIIAIAGTICGCLSGIVVAIVKFGKYDEESTNNKQAAARYTSIESSVRRQLSLYRKDRTSASSYMEWLESKFEELFLSAPLLPPRAYDEYYNIAKKMGLNVPNRYEATISINTEYEDRNASFNNNTTINVNEVSSVVNDDNETVRKEPSNSSTDTRTQSRKNNINQLPHLNQYSDRMLQYELSRMLGFNNTQNYLANQ